MRTYSSIAASVLLALVALIFSPAGVSATTYTLTPAADAYVYQASPGYSYGSDIYLRIRNQSTGFGQYSFLRFNIPALDGNVLSATLRLRAVSTITEVGYYHVTMGNPTWAETWITWNNWQTGSTFTHLGSRTNIPANTDLDLDVTGWIVGSPITFGLASSADINGQRFYSKEYGSFTPQLVIQTDGVAPPPECQTPEDLLGELLGVLQSGTLPNLCNYLPKLDPDFKDWEGGSENLPVIAAAIALFEGPVVNGTDYRFWWQAFLDRQASPPGSPIGIGHSRFFKGTELFSNVYDAFTTTGVMAAHYWAYTHPGDASSAAITSKAQDYLRRTWYAYALSASPVDFTAIYNVLGTTRNLVHTNNRNCAALAMASSRSRTDYNQDSKRWLFGKAAGFSLDCYKAPNIRDVVNHLAAGHPSVYGLTATQRNEIQALVNHTTVPQSSLSSILGAVRMKTDFHFLLWSDGRRATYYLGPQLNNNIAVKGGKGTVYTAVFDRGTRELELLFELATGTQSCLDSAARRIYVDDSGTGCGSNHWITLPATNPTYHFVLGPNGWRSCSNLACT